MGADREEFPLIFVNILVNLSIKLHGGVQHQGWKDTRSRSERILWAEQELLLSHSRHIQGANSLAHKRKWSIGSIYVCLLKKNHLLRWDFHLQKAADCSWQWPNQVCWKSEMELLHICRKIWSFLSNKNFQVVPSFSLTSKTLGFFPQVCISQLL